MQKSGFSHFLGFVLIFLSASNANAQSFTTDGGLDWLNLSETANMEYDAALISFPGWRHATNAEIEALFSRWFPAFVPDLLTGSADSFFSPYPGIRDEATAFITAFGPIPDPGDGWIRALGVYRDENDTLRPLGALDNDPQAWSQVLGPEYINLPITGPSPNHGIFLVRGATAPTDVTPPFLVSVTVDPQSITTLDGAKEVTITVSATDSESGVAQIELFLDDPGSQDTTIGISLSETIAPPETTATRTFAATFEQNFSEGLWNLSGNISDASGNSTDIEGGVNGTPEGVRVGNSYCRAKDVQPRNGPYRNVSFGQATDVNANYQFVSQPGDIRQIQRQMEQFDGWDQELRAIDYAVYSSYCELQGLKSWLKKGSFYVNEYARHREIIEDLIEDDMYIKIERLKIILNQIEAEMNLSHYKQLRETLVQADIRVLILNDPDPGTEFLSATSDWINIKSFLEYFSGVTKVTRFSVFATVLDIFSIVRDSQTIYSLLGEDEIFEAYGNSFNELWAMYLELHVLLEQYEKQRVEYRKLLSRTR